MKDCSISIAKALEILQFCTKPSICQYHSFVNLNSFWGDFYLVWEKQNSKSFRQRNTWAIACIRTKDVTPWLTNQSNVSFAITHPNVWLRLQNKSKIDIILVQKLRSYQNEKCHSTAETQELHLFCINPSKYWWRLQTKNKRDEILVNKQEYISAAFCHRNKI